MLPNLSKNKIVIFTLSILLLGISPLFSSQKPENLKRSSAYKNIPVKIVETIPLPRGWHEGLFLNGTDIWVSNGHKGKVWVVDTESGKVVSNIEPIAGFSEAVFGRGDGLFFVTEWDEERVYKARLDGKRLIPESSVSVSPAHPAGALWNGDKLLVIVWTRGMGTKFDLLEMGADLNVLSRISIQNIEEPAHLAWDGENLWVTSWYYPLVYKVDIKRREILGAFRSPVSMTTGIAWDGKYLWLTGTYSDLYKLEIAK